MKADVLVVLMVGVITFSLTKGQERRCDVPADVVFLMDASDSIKDTEWEQEKEFVSVLIDNLEVDRYAIHVGVIVYSTELGQVIDLQPFKTKSQLKSLLRQATKINQGTDTAKAISKMVEMSEGQGRLEAGAKQIAVIITDGRSTDVSATIREARKARLQHHIEMIALGVGNETFLEELVEIAGPQNAKRLFEVRGFSQLRDVVAQLQDLICELIPATSPATIATSTTTGPPTTSPYIPPFPCSRPADIILLIDGSYSITPDDWKKGRQFISYLINNIDIEIDSVNIGIIVYGSDIGDVVSLKPFKDKSILKAAATSLIQPPVGKTNTALGLQKVREMFLTQGRPDVPYIVIVITDGMSSNPSETRDQAALAKAESITVFVVGVGERVLRQEVEEMASSLDSLFDVPDYQFLVGMVQQLRDKICTAIQVTTRQTTPTTTTTTTSTTPPPIPELCKECLVEGGVGFNPSPTDCDKYIMCVPEGLSYTPLEKSCPFGMFWSSAAVSCMDARFVDCVFDKCRALPALSTYPSSSSNCRSYYNCSGGRSTPACCSPGFRYIKDIGCTADPSCRDTCPLNITIYNQGSCRHRADPDSYYGYLELVPGQGQIKRSCDPGQVYSQSKCSCTFNADDVMSNIACVPSINFTFDGNFVNHAPLLQPTNIHHVGLTNVGTASFNRDSSIILPATSGQNFGKNLVIKFKFRFTDKDSEKVWNNNGDWGFQSWFNNASNGGNAHPVILGQSEVTEPDVGQPKGSILEPLEVVTFTGNGTVIRDPKYNIRVNSSGSLVNQSTAEIIHLGKIGSLSTPSIVNGMILVPIGKKMVLVQETMKGVSGSLGPMWKILVLNPDGQTWTVQQSGHGSVPLTVQESFGFDLRPPIIEKWFILAPGGVVMQSGEGPIPEDVVNRYAGFVPGTLVKIFERGEHMERWQISKPDGSQSEVGTGPIPQNLVVHHKLGKVLSPLQRSTTWSVLSPDGNILDTGTGNIPPTITQKYIDSPSMTILTATSRDGHDQLWKLSRPSGVTVLEGQGTLPHGISRFINGDVTLPQISSHNKWSMTLPDGSVRNGSGQIPPDILSLFQTIDSAGSRVLNQGTHLSSRWAITMPNGSVQHGEGPIPDNIKHLMNSQGSNIEKRWQITLTDGSVRSGVGEVPHDLTALNKERRIRKAALRKPETIDLIANCDDGQQKMAPSIHVFASKRDVTFRLRTVDSPGGVTLTLPLQVNGNNEVTFIYDGSHVIGNANGFVSKQPLQGDIETRPSSLVIGQCLNRPANHFVGEIDEIQIYFC